MEKTKQKMYAIVFEYSDDDSNFTDIKLYTTREKALVELKRLIKVRVDTHWKIKDYTTSQDTDEYCLDTNLDNENCFEVYWLINKYGNFYIHDFIELRELEVIE